MHTFLECNLSHTFPIIPYDILLCLCFVNAMNGSLENMEQDCKVKRGVLRDTYRSCIRETKYVCLKCFLAVACHLCLVPELVESITSYKKQSEKAKELGILFQGMPVALTKV